ncbi:hypothetical protein HYC85_015249 [Camellia sinensis]|uniref:Formin-like protein n=1 Tax=Camellia sinensis TaxID=4442 RepID=A0A7J7GYF0_CAMSI|nr:hypothetical protein HYC85_015249 [Camellia sinensis]
MEDSTESIQDFDFYFLHATIDSYNKINSDAVLLTKRKLQNAITDLPPQAKQTLLDCLETKKFPFHTSGNEANSGTWFDKCLELLFGWSDVSRRSNKSHDHIAESPAPTPSLSEPVSSPSSVPQPHANDPVLFRRRNLKVSPPPPKVKKPPPRKVKKSPPSKVKKHTPKKKNDNQKYTIIAIAATAAAILVLVSLLLCCCLKGKSKRVDPRDEQRDDKPLLNCCLSDMSGSSQKSRSVGNSSNKDFKTSSLNNLSNDGHGCSMRLEVHLEPTIQHYHFLQEGPLLHHLGLLHHLNLPLRELPPPPRVVRPPPVPLAKPSPLGPHHRGHSSSGGGDDLTGESESQKTKLKPFFWDKVLANPDQSMVWHELKTGSFQVNEEMMESLFGITPAEKSKDHKKNSSSFDPQPQYIKIIDAKKSQNLAILLKALNVTTEEVCDALREGNELPAELVQTFGDLSQLGPAERFLKVMFAFKRLESLLFMSSVQEEFSAIKESFQTLKVASTELKNSRLFLKLLEAVLKTGNRMNDGTFRGGAQAFKLDTLLKLSDVKGTNGKTTLLHFVVQEIVRSEGIRAARTARQSQSMSNIKTEDLVEDSTHETEEYYRILGLQVVSGLSNDLENVKKAAVIDGDSLTATVSKLGSSLSKTKQFLNNEMSSEEDSRFYTTLANFVQHAEDEITWMLEEEKRIMALVKSTIDYFQGNAGKEEGLRLFVIVRDFLIILDKACKEVRNSATMPLRTPRKETSSAASTSFNLVSLLCLMFANEYFQPSGILGWIIQVLMTRASPRSSDEEYYFLSFVSSWVCF